MKRSYLQYTQEEFLMLKDWIARLNNHIAQRRISENLVLSKKVFDLRQTH